MFRLVKTMTRTTHQADLHSILTNMHNIVWRMTENVNYLGPSALSEHWPAVRLALLMLPVLVSLLGFLLLTSVYGATTELRLEPKWVVVRWFLWIHQRFHLDWTLTIGCQCRCLGFTAQMFLYQRQIHLTMEASLTCRSSNNKICHNHTTIITTIIPICNAKWKELWMDLEENLWKCNSQPNRLEVWTVGDPIRTPLPTITLVRLSLMACRLPAFKVRKRNFVA